MKKLLFKLLLISLPFLFIAGVYLYFDPFRVLYHYKAFYQPYDSIYFQLDDDYISTQTLLQNYSTSHYDSYIFGGSRSDFYAVDEWKKHISSTNCYHYSSAYESLYGVEKKMLLIKQKGYDFNNALVILDHDLMSEVKNQFGPLTLKHPALSGQSEFGFQTEFFKYFLDKDFLFAYIDLKFSGHLKKYMTDEKVFSFEKFRYDQVANEFKHIAVEEEWLADSQQFYTRRTNVFYDRPSAVQYGKPVIGPTQEEMLRNMKAVMADKKTSYKIVVNPLYDQLQLDPADLAKLQEIFGKENIFDFSGRNAITDNKFNYYETSHYRPRVANYVMNVIYSR